MVETRLRDSSFIVFTALNYLFQQLKLDADLSLQKLVIDELDSMELFNTRETSIVEKDEKAIENIYFSRN